MLWGSPRRPVGILATRRQASAPQQRRRAHSALAAAAALLLVFSGLLLFQRLGAGSLPGQELQPEGTASSGVSHRDLRERRLHGSRPTNTLSRETSTGPGSSGASSRGVSSGNVETAGATAIHGSDSSRGADDVVAPGSSSGVADDADAVTAPGSSGGTGFLGPAGSRSDATQQPADSPAQAPLPQLSQAELHGGWKLSREVGRSAQQPAWTLHASCGGPCLRVVGDMPCSASLSPAW